MKCILSILFLLVTANSIFAQNIGIGTTNPHASAQLDISSNNRGLLIPRLTTTQQNAIPSPAVGLLVYDSTLQDLMYFQNGWKSTGSLKLPFTGNYSSNSTLLSINNTGLGTGISSTSANGVAVRASSNENVAVWGETDNGYGGYFSSNPTGTALAVDGKIMLSGSTGSTGSIMSVNAAGNASWMPAVAFSANSNVSGGQNIASNTDVVVNFTSGDYNIGADYNFTTNTFIAPVYGIYHFDAMVMWESPASSTGYLAISIRVNNSTYTTVRTPAVAGRNSSNTISLDIELNPADLVRVLAYQTTGVTLGLFDSPLVNRFTGRLVMWR